MRPAGVALAVVGVSVLGCGWFGGGEEGPESTDAAALPLQPETPEGPVTLEAPTVGDSQGMGVITGMLTVRDGVPVLTSCDGREQLHVVPSESDRELVQAIASGPGPTFLVARGDRRARTADDLKAGWDGTLADATLLQHHALADGDCGIGDLGSNGVFRVPRDGKVSFDGIEAMRVNGHVVFDALPSDIPGVGRSREEAVEARIAELTLGWCDGLDKVRPDGFRVRWDTKVADGTETGSWELSCGRSRNASVRVGVHPPQEYGVTVDGQAVTMKLPLMDCEKPDGAVRFGSWSRDVHRR